MPVNPARIQCSDPQEIHESPWIGNPSAMTRQKWNNDGRFPVLPDNRGDD